MAGQPVWCPEEEAYGIVMCDKQGKWAGIPFLHGVWQQDEVGVEFNHNIIGRKLKCFRIEDKKRNPDGADPKSRWLWERKDGVSKLRRSGCIQSVQIAGKVVSALPLVRPEIEGRSEMSKKYTEIHVLKDRLREAGIPYEAQKAYDGWQVGIPHLYPEEDRISVIEHYSSYGSAFDLLEIQFPDGEIRGFLKAETAFTLIQRIREKEHEKKKEAEDRE